MNFSIKNRYVRAGIHFAAWGVFLALLSTLVPRPQIMNSVLPLLTPFLFFVAFFYLNFYILVPRLFIKKKYFTYLLVCLISLILTITIPSLMTGLSRPELPFPQQNSVQEPGIRPWPGPGPGQESAPGSVMEPGNFHRIPPDNVNHDLQRTERRGIPPPPARRIDFFRPEFSYTVLVFFLMLTLSTGLRIIQKWQQTEREKVNTELAFLKAQINPHFLFNTLNTIYSLAICKAEETPAAIEKFSDMMRFVIRDACHDFVPLSRKLEYIDTYIALQKYRLPPSVQINYNVSGNPVSMQIAPMIMMPFIENAFKYGVSAETKSAISIDININNSILNLNVKNPKFEHKNLENGTTRLGIRNTKKRLELIYPGKHKLDISESKTEYLVRLNLQLK